MGLTFSKPKENSFLIAVIVVSTFFCVYCAKFDLEIVNPYRFLDLGHQLYNYELTLLGETPYVDFWTNWWAPASFYLNALALKLFGVSIYSVNLMLAIVMVVSVAALFCISERVVPKPVALTIALVSLLWGNFTLNFPYSGWYSSCFGLLALLAFIKYLESPKRKTLWLIATGCALGLTFSFKQHIGVLNSVAIAVVTAFSVRATEGKDATEANSGVNCGVSQDTGLFQKLTTFCYFALLIPGHILIPFFFLRARYQSEGEIGVKPFVIFFLPVFIINLLLLIILFRAVILPKRYADHRSLFRTLIGREIALAAGFILVVAPWFAYFSHLTGWDNFYKLIFLMHPMQENFKQTYLAIMSDVKFPHRSVIFFLWMLFMCATIISLFILSKSKRMLRMSTALSVCILVVAGLLILPIGPKLGQMLHFPSDFDAEYFVHCENKKLIGPMYYFPLLVDAVLLAALLMKGRGRIISLLSSKASFVILTLAVFNIYNYMSLLSFVDRAHLQMVLFPWLALNGYVAYLIYDKACSLLLNKDFAVKSRRKGILVAVAIFFLVPYVGKPFLIVQLQYIANSKYCEYISMISGKKYKTLKEIRGSRGGVYINHANREEFKQIVEQIKSATTEDDYLFGAPCTTLFNFLAGRRFPSKYSYLIFNSLSDGEKDDLLKEISENKPKFYVFDDFYKEEVHIPSPTETEKFARDFPAVKEYVSENYELEKEIGRFHLYRRSEPAMQSERISKGFISP